MELLLQLSLQKPNKHFPRVLDLQVICILRHVPEAHVSEPAINSLILAFIQVEHSWAYHVGPAGDTEIENSDLSPAENHDLTLSLLHPHSTKQAVSPCILS